MAGGSGGREGGSEGGTGEGVGTECQGSWTD